MEGQFSGKHALITGGARGIGFEIARQFGQQGAMITIFDNAENLLADATAKFKKEQFEIHPFLVDVSRRSDVSEAVDAAEEVAPIDILINNAGIAFETPFLQIDEAEWKKIIDVNLTGIFLVAQTVCKQMAPRKKGVVINMSSKNTNLYPDIMDTTAEPLARWQPAVPAYERQSSNPKWRDF